MEMLEGNIIFKFWDVDVHSKTSVKIMSVKASRPV